MVNLSDTYAQALTVSELLAFPGELDVVLLDVRLNDHSGPEDNVRRLTERGWSVLLYTQEPRPAVLARCLRAGARGIVGKHESWEVLADAVRVAAADEDFMNPDWAAAVEALTFHHGSGLSPREAEVIALYATGLPLKSVSRRLGIAEETAKEHLRRARRKYASAGRSADTKTALYLRALEDGYLEVPHGS